MRLLINYNNATIPLKLGNDFGWLAGRKKYFVLLEQLPVSFLILRYDCGVKGVRFYCIITIRSR